MKYISHIIFFQYTYMGIALGSCMIRIIMFYSSREEVKWVQYISHVHVCWEFVVGSWGWLGGAMVLGKLPVPGRPTIFYYNRARAYCACSRCGRELFGHFYSHLFFLSSFSLSLGDGPI